jgi:hypothetical protein
MAPHQGGCWEGQWKRAAGSIFSRGSPLPNISGYGIAIAGSLICVGLSLALNSTMMRGVYIAHDW